MSAKGRGPSEGGDHEVFPTPAWAVHRLLDRIELPDGPILEPCAGYGAIIRAVESHPSTKRRRLWHAFEIRPEVEPLLTSTLASIGSPRPIIGDFLKQMNFLGGDERSERLRHDMPIGGYLLPNRPQFRGEGSDSTEYAWMVWPAGHDGARLHVSRTGLEILDSTPLEVRKADKLQAETLLRGIEFAGPPQLALGGIG